MTITMTTGLSEVSTMTMYIPIDQKYFQLWLITMTMIDKFIFSNLYGKFGFALL